MSGFEKVVSVDSVRLVVVWLTFEPIQHPIRPIDISLSKVSDEEIPRNIGCVSAKLSQPERNTHRPHKSHIPEHLLFKLLVSPSSPAHHKP